MMQTISGGLCIIPGSHLHHNEVCERAFSNRTKHDFVLVSGSDPVMQRGGVLIKAKAGDLILWDSRLIHCNTPALNTGYSRSLMYSDGDGDESVLPAQSEVKEPSSGWDIIRLVAYVCMVPKSTCTEQVLESRKTAFINKAATSHWPNVKLTTFPISNPMLLPRDDLTNCPKEMLRLVGYDVD